MLLHSLEITAFGPFSDTVTVDFDQLSAAGLFLLSGQTGAGKTSVLDAVCFALYGDVPGDRSSAKRFRCDTAPAGLAPRVVLEATLAGRRFRLTRSPSWQRPKKRGSGHTTEQAHVLLEEHLDDVWVALSNRMDEAGHLVTDLVGMTMPQFCQVAMLPQGRFQTFLRARSEERHRLLQQLFSTQRFEDMERWLREHARELHRRSQARHREVAGVVSRLLEAAAAPLPEGWDHDDLTTVAGSGELADWSADLAAAATSADAQAAAQRGRAQDEEQAAAAARDTGRQVREQQRRVAAARAERGALDAEAAAQAARRSRLELARRASAVTPLHRLALSARQQRDRAGEAALSAFVAAAGLLDLHDPTPHDLATAETDARDLLADARSLLPREAELEATRARIAADEVVEAELVAEERRLTGRLTVLPVEVAGLTTRLDEARAAAVRLDELVRLVAEQADRLAALDRAAVLREELRTARVELSASVDLCQDLKETWLGIREARLQGMAAEIALDLAVGACCPVCGSADHPHKAVPDTGAPSAVSEKAARSALDDAELTRAAHDARVRDLLTSLSVAEARAGDDRDADTLRSSLGSLRAERTTLAGRAAEQDELTARLTRTRAALDDVATDRTATQVELAGTRARLTGARAELERIRAEVDALLAGTGQPTLEALAADQTLLVETLTTARSSAERHEAATRSATEAEAALSGWLDEHGFTELDAALEAVLPVAALDSLDAEVATYDARAAAVAAVLADPDLAAAATLPAPDTVALDAALAQAARAHAEATTAHEVAATRARRLTALDADLRAALTDWAPLRESWAVAAELASFVEGKSADNALRMRLSAYVLAWRLTQVVAAANQRLLRMSDQRYTLEHTGQRGAGETRGGLSLLVRDEWSGEARDPATLSGGETFVVSLALALGLADVVTAEAGGADLDTLFVDEGFGALDADTLDDVMGTLDGLRDGGRVVGVVSHVGELRTRIPTQLVVTKQRAGSTVHVGRSHS
ncbi:MAG: SMC family ATPase [Nocardioides sp.]